MIDRSYAAKQLGGDLTPNGVVCPGPGHSARDRSLSVSFDPGAPEGFVVHSFSDDDAIACRDHVRGRLGLPEWKPERAPDKPKPTRATVVCHYIYHDDIGDPYLRVTRMSDKSFRQSHWEIDGWETGKPKGDPVPYRLPDIIARPDETIWLVEGEKDADNLSALGLLATTAPGGGGNFPTTPDFGQWFDGRKVIAIMDNDATGLKWRERVTQSIADVTHLTMPAPHKDVSDWLKAGGRRDLLEAMAAHPQPVPLLAEPAPVAISPTPYTWQEANTIKRREWLYGRHLIRRYVSTTISPGGLGKSSMVMVEALAMVSGKPLLEERIHTPEPLRVWYWNGEDPNDESARRIQAAAIQHKLKPTDIGDRLFVDSGREMSLKLAFMTQGRIELDDDLFNEITDALIARKIDVWTIDPFISSHQVSENDNGAIDAVIKRLGIVAERANCAIELVHHVRKGNGKDETTVEDARGASALIGGVRSARVLNVMSKDIADAAKVDAKDRYSHFSVTNGKSNMGPRSDVGVWRKIVSVDLENGGLALDSSDHVGVVIPFKMPDMLSDIPANAAEIAQDVARQFDMGRVSPRSPDWFGYIVGPRLGIDVDNEEGKRMVKILMHKWIENDVLAIRAGPDKAGNKRDFITVPDSASPFVASVQGDDSDAPF